MKLKEIKADLGSLFTMNLSYNFDALKIMLQDMYDNQKEIITKSNEMEEKLKSYDKELTETKAKTKQLQNRLRRKKKKGAHAEGEDAGDEDEEDDNEEEESEEDNVDALSLKDKVNDLEQQPNEGNGINFKDDNNIKALSKRISSIEKNIQRLSKNKYPSLIQPSSLVINKSQNSYSDQIKEMNDKIAQLTSTVEEMAIKVNDFNVTDLFKDAQTDEGKIDTAKLLVLNLESKVFKKFGLTDEKHRKIEEEIFKINRELNNINVKNDNYDVIFTHFETQFQKLFEGISKENEKIADIEAKWDNCNQKTRKDMDIANESIKKILDDIAKIKVYIDDNSKDNQKGFGLNENDLQYIKDLFKRVNEIEKALKLLTHSTNTEAIREDLKQLHTLLKDKCSNLDLYETNEKITLQNGVINTLKDVNAKLIEDRTKLSTDVNFLTKKLESINAAVILLKANNENNANKTSAVDTSKFVELFQFQEFIKVYSKDQEKIMNDQEELKRFIDEVANSLQAKASDDDLKNLEGFLIARLEELKLFCTRKFADKAETAKSIKYLDTQIKHLLEIYSKRTEKAENWLIAKKPIGGFSCASCESYIGDLPEKKDYLAWNKYPLREAQDKAYRIGNGFSRMLNMLNIDIKTSNDANNTSDHIYESDGDIKNKNQDQIMGQRAINLPSIQINKMDEPLNMSADILSEDMKMMDSKDPKVIKIYKKNKGASLDLTKPTK